MSNGEDLKKEVTSYELTDEEVSEVAGGEKSDADKNFLQCQKCKKYAVDRKTRTCTNCGANFFVPGYLV